MRFFLRCKRNSLEPKKHSHILELRKKVSFTFASSKDAFNVDLQPKEFSISNEESMAQIEETKNEQQK